MMDEQKPSGELMIGNVRDAYAGRLFPTVQIETFRNIDRLFPTRTVTRGEDKFVRPFGYRPLPLDDMTIETDQGDYDLFDYVARNRVTALLVARDGKIVREQYEYGNGPETRWMSMSMAKSVSTTLVGAAIKDGSIGSLDDQLSKYLPSLKGSSYDGVTVKHLLQMTSGVRWDETHTFGGSERRQVLELQIAQQPGAILEYMANLPRVAEPGTHWNYSTGETHVVGELIRAATGEYLSDYLSRKIWSRLGMAADATWWLEAPDGLEVAGSGLSATLRDYARFGHFIMNGGVIDGEAVLPDWWVKEAGSSREVGGQPLDYGFMWWPVKPPAGTQFEAGFSARGIFGQYMYINPAEKIVIVVWSARAKPIGSEVILDNDFFNAVVKTIR
ncbi:serine hydrolase domain-containing protein [Gimibacter soli]|uniref:Serine hydrolase n=1 Tax=Gimibacter soli TaxID=3024400 RepID=A0AAE9XV61_9PROT|nr:serine hydrolase [Gimibacter soli]WCL53394.1 serine hydrolase [Gimibacter soli]